VVKWRYCFCNSCQFKDLGATGTNMCRCEVAHAGQALSVCNRYKSIAATRTGGINCHTSLASLLTAVFLKGESSIPEVNLGGWITFDKKG